MLLYKIFTRPEWEAFRQQKVFRGSRDDQRDGFIHLSEKGQLDRTRARHFAGQTDLVVCALNVADDPRLKWQPSPAGALYPHLYRALSLDDAAEEPSG